MLLNIYHSTWYNISERLETLAALLSKFQISCFLDKDSVTEGAYSTILTEEKSAKCWSENLKEGDHLGDLSRDGRGERWTGFIQLRAGANGTVAVGLITS